MRFLSTKHSRAVFAIGSALVLSACGRSGDSASPTGARAVRLRGPGGEQAIFMARTAVVSLVATALNSDGDIVQGVAFEYTSRNATIATIDANGRVTGVANGTTLVVAQAMNGTTKLADSITVSVAQ